MTDQAHLHPRRRSCRGTGRTLLGALVATCAGAAAAQDLAPAIDLGTVAQGAVIQGTMQGHADRGYARQRGARPAPVQSPDCAKLWRLRDRITRAGKNRLYDLCPR